MLEGWYCRSIANETTAVQEERRQIEESKFKKEYKYLKRKFQNLVFVSIKLTVYIICQKIILHRKMNRFNKHFDQLKNDYLLLQETETFYSTDCLCMKNMSKVAQNQKTLIPQKMEKLLRRNKSKGTQVFSFFYKF